MVCAYPQMQISDKKILVIVRFIDASFQQCYDISLPKIEKKQIKSKFQYKKTASLTNDYKKNGYSQTRAAAWLSTSDGLIIPIAYSED
jgi:hypothetical protein